MTKPITHDEQMDVAVAAQSIMNQDSSQGHSKHVFMPNVIMDKKVVSPAIWKALSKLDKAHCVIINLHAEIICTCPHRGPSVAQKQDMQKMLQMKAQEKSKAAGSSLGAIAWNSSLVRPASDYSITPRMGSDMISADNLSKLVFCFQHYALNSKANDIQSDLDYPSLIAGGRDFPERNGVLDAATRQMLEHLWSSNFVRVAPNAQPLAPMGKLFGAAIMANATWPSLVALMIQQFPPRSIPAAEKFSNVLQKDSNAAAMYSSNLIGADQSPLALLNVNVNNISNPQIKQLAQALQLAHAITQQAAGNRAGGRTTEVPSRNMQAQAQLQQEAQDRAERDARARRARDMASRSGFGDY